MFGSTLQLSSKICDSLPLELRHHIYSYLELDRETKYEKPIDSFTDPSKYCPQFSRECLLWYFENVPQMLCHPFFTSDFDSFLRSRYFRDKVKRKIPGLVVVVETQRRNHEFEIAAVALREAMFMYSPIQDLHENFKLRIYIDGPAGFGWNTEDENIQFAIYTVLPIFRFFQRERPGIAEVWWRMPNWNSPGDTAFEITEVMDNIDRDYCIVRTKARDILFSQGQEYVPPRVFDRHCNFNFDIV